MAFNNWMRLNESKISNETENSNNAFQNRSMCFLFIDFDNMYDVDWHYKYIFVTTLQGTPNS